METNGKSKYVCISNARTNKTLLPPPLLLLISPPPPLLPLLLPPLLLLIPPPPPLPPLLLMPPLSAPLLLLIPPRPLPPLLLPPLLLILSQPVSPPLSAPLLLLILPPPPLLLLIPPPPPQPDLAFLHALELFACGIYDDYLNNNDNEEGGYYLSLTNAQLLKLKQLTIVATISSHETPHAPYSILCDKLHISTMRELEDLSMECAYSNVITGKCDQRTMCFISTGIVPVSRDVKLECVQDPCIVGYGGPDWTLLRSMMCCAVVS